MQYGLLVAILCGTLFLCVDRVTSDTYSKVYVSSTGDEYVVDHDLSYLDCRTGLIMTAPNFRCVRED